MRQNKHPRPGRAGLTLKFLLLSVCYWSLTAFAQLTIEVRGHGTKRIPVVITEFAGNPEITAVIRSDLERSGLFELVDAAGTAMTESSSPDYARWSDKGHALLAGSTTTLSNGHYETRYRLHDLQNRTLMAGQVLSYTKGQSRATAHRIADTVYEKFTGQRGYYSTRIAYVVKNRESFELQVADQDGMNPQAALRSREAIISPAWSPDGSKLAYVSFEAKKPVVYVHDLPSGKRHVVANFKGSNSAPAWSPDGRKLAVVLTRDGSSQLYLVNADGSGINRLSSSSGIDTEPQFSPNGEFIYFTSDRGGSPQVYRQPVSKGSAQRITHKGNYNATPRVSPDGRQLAFITRDNGRFQLALMDLANSEQMLTLTDTVKDESPSFAPNGRMLLFATEVEGKGVLAAVSTDGTVKHRLSIAVADAREPAWGPFNP
jgi:TolB protein